MPLEFDEIIYCTTKNMSFQSCKVYTIVNQFIMVKFTILVN